MIIFKSKQKKLEGDLKIKLCGKRLYPTESVKYVGVKIDANLTWKHNINDLSIELNRANAFLFKIRKYISPKILRSIYFAIFDSYLSYCCLAWAQNFSNIKQILILPKRLLELLLIFNQGIPIPVPYSSKTSSQNSKIKFAQKIFYLSANLQIIHHHQFLIHGLVFPHTNLTMKPPVIYRGTS